ncbi:hypothetical protein [Aureispira anguillae]|uniref:Uncharacterized protein n=1 Tax=Aureispira anguillae TaxID=2864201 RepID=A0A915YBQ3_9BACT|nr:hypothetical protein [Aureispira anguillae]BDS10142.1 hypothetical protein AsAng_0008500 [Aureispira anguillae]
MLKKFIQLLTNSQLHLVSEIKALDKSCCPSSKQVIDFDAVKNIYCKNTAIKTIPKSCDALLIEPNKDKISFIEMKEIVSLIQELEQLKKAPTSQGAKDLVEYVFKTQFRADKKILDSTFLLLDIAQQLDMDKDFYPYFVSNACNKKFYFVLGCTSREFVQWRYSILPLMYKYEYFKFGQIELIPAGNFDQVFS